MFGTELPPGTYADALVHYTRAAELNPRRLAHRLGRSFAFAYRPARRVVGPAL